MKRSKTIYVGGIYEVDKSSGGSVTHTRVYYPAGGAMRVDGTLYYILKDHLGSASVVTNSTGTDVGGQRYYPFGETRFTTGTMYTDKLFTGQREMMGLGIYHYGARFYSPKLGRFLSADTIVPGMANPQNLNRYAYVLNNPVRYTDPTGHRCVEDGFEGSCGAVELKITKKYVANSKRSDFEKKALLKLSEAGKLGKDIFEYIVLNNVKIDFKWHLYAGAVWDDEDNALYLNRDPDTTRPDDPFVLNLIAHETTHLQQGDTWALTKAGELEAWKVGFTVQNHFTPLTEGTPAYKIVHDLDIWDTNKFTELVHEYNKNAPGGWIYNFLFDRLPDVPLGIQMSPGR